MLSGKRAFLRDTPVETMTAVLKEDPPELTDPVHPISPALDRIVRRCLEKSPEQRFHSAKDLSFALSSFTDTRSSGVLPIAEAQRRVPWLLMTGAALVLIAVSGVTWFLANRHAPQARMQFAIPVAGEVSHMALSRDGSMLVFVSPDENSGRPILYVQRVGSPTAVALDGTEGASFPFWSPDGAYIAFFANGKLEKIPASGGTPQVLVNVESSPRGGDWGSRNVIIYAPDSGSTIWRVNPDGTGAQSVTDHVYLPSDDSHRWPEFLPDGNHFLFWAGNFGNLRDDRSSGIYASSLDGRERKLVTLVRSSFGLDSKHLLYANDQRQLVSVSFDESKAVISGGTTVVANAVGFQPSTYWVAFTVAANGTLIYNTSAGAVLSQLTWMDRAGKTLGTIGQSTVIANPAISPDGSRVAIDITDQKANNVDIWIENASGTGSSRFTFDPAEEVAGVWSRDGNMLAYRKAGTVLGQGLELKRASGLEPEKLIFNVKGEDDIIPNSWSEDGQQILCEYQSPSGSHLVLVPAVGGTPTPFKSGPGNQTNGQISPDGKWVAYASDESGNWEIYVTTFPGAAGKWQVSSGGGVEPRWRGDGKEIFYIGSTGMLTAVPVNAGATFSSGTPTPLFQIRGRAPISSTDVFSYDVAKDGQRFLVNRYVKPEQIAPLNIVLNAGAQP